jgi:group I intron endonuclease
MPPTKIVQTGVYSIFNKINNKQYVGSASVSFKRRWGLHRCLLNLGTHGNKHLQSAWTKYGEDSFSFVVLERCPPEKCVAREQFWIDKLNAANPLFGYNISPKAGSCLGMKLTQEQRLKIGKALKGRVFSQETLLKMSLTKKGKPSYERTPEHKLKMSKRLKGRKMPNGTKQKLRDANLGKKASPEARKNMSLSQLRRYGK